MAILDTSVVIDVLRGSSAATDFLLSLDEPPICSEVVRVEVMRGLRTAERAAAERLLHEIRWIGLDEPIARLAGEMGRKWRRSHAGISTPDLIVAATAQRLGAALVTTNVRDFPMFKDLQPPYEG